TFRSLDSFFAGRPDSTHSMSGEASVEFAALRAGAFVQDHWTPTLTVDAGARFDSTRFPSSLGISNWQVSPRVGIAWTTVPGWVIRGGAGTFADRLVLASIERALTADQRGVVERVSEDTGATALSIYPVRRGAWNPASVQARLARISGVFPYRFTEDPIVGPPLAPFDSADWATSSRWIIADHGSGRHEQIGAGDQTVGDAHGGRGDQNVAIELRAAGAVDLAHAARAESRDN